MGYLAGVCLLLVQMLSVNAVFAQQPGDSFKKGSFYMAMSANTEAPIDQQLALLKTIDISGKGAYEGALLMRKAGMVGGAKKKLDLFKTGHKKLEAALNKDSANTEFRFLRLMIQEHAPAILGYKAELEKDKLFIKNNFKKLSVVIQEAIVNYSKASKILKPGDL